MAFLVKDYYSYFESLQIEYYRSVYLLTKTIFLTFIICYLGKKISQNDPK